MICWVLDKAFKHALLVIVVAMVTGISIANVSNGLITAYGIIFDGLQTITSALFERFLAVM